MFAATDLVGLWAVRAAGEPSGTLLRLGEDLRIIRSAGYVTGEWVSDDEGLFLGAYQYFGGQVGSESFDSNEPTWLVRAALVRRAGDGYDLLDRSGTVTAQLTPREAVGAHTGVRPGNLPVPSLTDALRTRLTGDEPLPAGIVPAAADTVVGTWGTADAAAERSLITVKPDGTWAGSGAATDGCNPTDGAWNVSAGAVVTLNYDFPKIIDCTDPAATAWWTKARRAGFDGDRLILFGHDGNVLGRLAPTVDPAAPPSPAAGIHTFVSVCGFPLQFKPKTITIACGDAGYTIEELTWTSWTNDSAVAKGEAHFKGDNPYPVSITLDAPEAKGPQRWFSHLSVTFTARKPSAMSSYDLEHIDLPGPELSGNP